jgi:hypothetical protein
MKSMTQDLILLVQSNAECEKNSESINSDCSAADPQDQPREWTVSLFIIETHYLILKLNFIEGDPNLWSVSIDGGNLTGFLGRKLHPRREDQRGRYLKLFFSLNS